MYFYMKAFLLRQLSTKVTGIEHLVVILRNSYSKCDSLQYGKSQTVINTYVGRREKELSHECQQGCENHIQKAQMLYLHQKSQHNNLFPKFKKC